MDRYNQFQNAISIIFMLPILIVGIFVCLWEELEALYQ